MDAIGLAKCLFSPRTSGTIETLMRYPRAMRIR